MGNFGKSELHQNNVLRFVKALLLLTQENSKLKDSQLSTAVQAKWVQDAKNRLEVTGEYKTKTPTGKVKREKGTTKQALWQLVEKTDTPLELPPRQGDKSSRTKQERQDYVLKSVFEYLEELGLFKDERPENKRNTRYWIFTLTLKHKDASLEENLGIVKQKLGLETSPSTEDSGVLPLSFWQDYCRKMLPAELSINPLLHGDGVELTLDDIVPLELVERKQQPQHEDDFSPDNFYKKAPTEYETPVEHSKFIAQALETGDSLKNRDRKIAVIGEPGAGKTTLLQEIAQAAEKAGGLPIFVRLADLGEKTLKDYLLKDWLEAATGKWRIPEDIQDEFVEQFKLGLVWLLLDGVDEISATGNLLSNLEKQLKGWVSEARIVLTCRVNVWDVGKNNLYAFEKYRIQPLSYPGLVDDFIHRFFSKAGEPTKGEKLIEKLESSQPRIRDLVKNPLRLTLLCRTWKRRQGELPQTKAELYKGFVETFYEWKDQSEIDLDKRQLLEQALGELAKNAIDKETTKFRLRESFVRRELDKFDKSLFDLACRVSWINHVGMAGENPDESVYAFFHPTFQEYFAALAIDDWDFFLPRAHDNRNPKPVSERYRIFEPQWKEVILLWLGREEVAKERKEEFIWRLARFKDGCGGFYHYRAYFLAAVGIAEFRDCSLADEIVEVILKCSFGYFNIEIQKWQKNFDIISTEAKNVLDVLAQTAHTKVIDVLTKQFPPDNLVSWEATLFLGKISDTNSTGIRALIDLLTSQYFLTRYEAAYSLARIGAGNQDIINSLTSLLNSTQDREIRLFVAWVLGKVDLGNQDALKALTELLHSSKDNETQLRVAEKLGEIDPGNTDAIKALIKFNSLQMPWKLYKQAEKSLRNIGASNPDAIAALNEMSPVIKYRNQRVSEEMLEYLGTSQSDLDSKEAIINQLDNVNVLVELLCTGHGKLFEFYINGMIKRRLIKITAEQPTVLRTLIKLLYDSQYDQIHTSILLIVRESVYENFDVVNTLIYLIKTSQNTSTIDAVTKILKGNFKDNFFSIIVSELKDYITTQVKENDFERYKDCYEIIWHCAQNITYPAFYQACHQQEEVDNTTTSNTQTLNQADLAQKLQTAITNDPQLSQTIHLICIDSSQCIEPDNPAEIYDQMLDQNCPDCDSVPETMPALKLYWNSLKRNSHKRHFLVFYASSTHPYNQAFLTALSKFGRAICVITEQPIDQITLKYFTPSQSIKDILEWIRTT